MASSSILSETLRSITLTKIKELEKQRASYETRKAQFLSKAAAAADQRDRITTLVEAIEELDPAAASDAVVVNIQRWLDQSRYDASIRPEMLSSFQKDLTTKLHVQSRRLELADLYSRLLTEWMSPTNTASTSAQQPEEDSFEVIERQKQRLNELVDKFESVVFEPLETDPAEINKFLDDLFPDDDSKKPLHDLRERMRKATKNFMNTVSPFNKESLTLCIKGLLTEDLLSDEKQMILRDFLSSPVALAEIADVLNMRYSDIKNWEWDAGEHGINVMPRQQLNGKYRIWSDDDILQMIFVQYIGIRMCNILKVALRNFATGSGAWRWEHGPRQTPAQGDFDRRHYFTGVRSDTTPIGVKIERKATYLETFFLCQLPEAESTLQDRGEGGYDDDDDDGDGDHSNSRETGGTSIKQKLLRQLTSDFLIQSLRGRYHGGPAEFSDGAAMVQTDLQWFATGLSHTTIFTVMRYVGFTEDWINFFRKYLEAPLNLDQASADRMSVGPRTRKRGVPMAHASEKLIGELILFLLDLTVNRRTGMLLYRLHDDIWLCGDPATCADAWESMNAFGKVLGLEFNRSKTGSVCVATDAIKSRVSSRLPTGPVTFGFLVLDPASGSWTIDKSLVNAHVTQLKKQLAECDSVLTWVQMWNSCIGRFFMRTFGEPANCLGPEHVDSILETYQSALQSALFSSKDGASGNVVDHVKDMIRSRFGAADLPDAFIFLPEQLGGLGLRNPFVHLFLVKEDLAKTPAEILNAFLEKEKKKYLADKRDFETASESRLRSRLHTIFPDAKSQEAASKAWDVETFMSLEEYAQFREHLSSDLCNTYVSLLGVPDRDGIEPSMDVERALKQAKLKGLEQEKWTLQLYADELLATYGGLTLVDKQFLPVGVLAMMGSNKVSWRMVL